MTGFWDSALRQLVPTKVKGLIKRSGLYLRHRSAYANVYHCCVHKTASGWIKLMLSDSRTYRWSGLSAHNYRRELPGRHDARKITDRAFAQPFPRETIVTSLFIDFENFMAVPKPERWRAFFVMRDPRDLVVSWYFSMRYSHPLIGSLPGIRKRLQKMSLGDGLLYTVERLRDQGHFSALRSWAELSSKEENTLLVKFEDLTGPDKLDLFGDLFSFCDIGMPGHVLRHLLEDYSFERLADRKRGEEDRHSHYRKGVAGDWRNYFTDPIAARFKSVTGDLVVHLGYEKDVDW
ncbi:MAG: sulfotransferase domain-containing protein [bacterium]